MGESDLTGGVSPSLLRERLSAVQALKTRTEAERREWTQALEATTARLNALIGREIELEALLTLVAAPRPVAGGARDYGEQ